MHFGKLSVQIEEYGSSHSQTFRTQMSKLFGLFVSAMQSFVMSCPELVTEDVIRRLLPPLECALTLTAQSVFTHLIFAVSSFLVSILL